MRSIKALIVSAAFGFLLSFVFGLFSHAVFWIILLRALISAAVFAGLGFGFFMLTQSFLFDDSENSEFSVEPAVSSSPVGNRVDLYVRDEELSPSDSENNYYVDDNSNQMLNSTDTKSSKALQVESEAKSFGSGKASPVTEPAVKASLETSSGSGGAFVRSSSANSSSPADSSLSKAESAEDLIRRENQKSASSSLPPKEEKALSSESSGSGSSENSGNSGNSGASEELDTLPDMSSFVMENGSSSSGDDDDIVSSVDSDSGFTTTVSSSSGSKDAGVQDAAIMAKAISSVLSSEES